MSSISATCPTCHATNEYGSELVGRYTLCLGCRSRFYVEVPTLNAPPRDPFTVGPAPTAKPDMTLDDLLYDTQQGTRFIIQSLQKQEAIGRTTRLLVVAGLVIGLANLAGLAFILMK